MVKPPVGTVRRALRLTGFVQGVGLRWRARTAAEALGATGWVRNDADGGVTMELQGTEAPLDGVLRAIERSPYVQIAGLTAKTLPLREGETGFLVLDDE